MRRGRLFLNVEKDIFTAKDTPRCPKLADAGLGRKEAGRGRWRGFCRKSAFWPLTDRSSYRGRDLKYLTRQPDQPEQPSAGSSAPAPGGPLLGRVFPAGWLCGGGRCRASGLRLFTDRCEVFAHERVVWPRRLTAAECRSGGPRIRDAGPECLTAASSSLGAYSKSLPASVASPRSPAESQMFVSRPHPPRRFGQCPDVLGSSWVPPGLWDSCACG